MTISVKPNEKGTAIVTFTFVDEDRETVVDEDGETVVPATIVPATSAWQLMRTDGTIINSRSFANCSFTGTEIVLSGDDLAIFGSSDSGVRIIAFQGTYNSSAGTGLPLNDEERFTIKKLVSQTDAG